MEYLAERLIVKIFSCCAWFCALILTFMSPSPALAQDAPPPTQAQNKRKADALHKQGVAELSSGNFLDGCGHLTEAQQIYPQPGTLFARALCYDRWGRIATAVPLYYQYLQEHKKMTPSGRASQPKDRVPLATTAVQTLTPLIPTLTLSLAPTVPPGAVVKRDGVVVGATDLGVAVPLDPGEYVLSVEAPSRPIAEQRIKLDKGDRKVVVLDVPPAPQPDPPPVVATVPSVVSPPPLPRTAPPVAPPPPIQAEPTARRQAAHVLLSVGVVSVAAGAVLGVAAARSGPHSDCFQREELLSGPVCVESRSGPSISAGDLTIASGVAIGAGMAAAGAAIVLYVTEPNADKPSASSRKVAARLSAGPTGATLGAHLTW